MAFKTTLTRSKPQLSTLFNRLLFSHPSSPSFRSSAADNIPTRAGPFFRPATSYSTNRKTPEPKKHKSKLVNFSPSSDSDSDSDAAPRADKPELPPPYDPFSKKPIEEPSDPKNVQEAFAKLQKDGLMNRAAKMFEGLTRDGLLHEALEMFDQMKDKGEIPPVIGHTAVLEVYVEAGQAKEAHKVYLRMLACGVTPNAYTYRLLIRVLAESGDAEMAKSAKKYVEEMVERGMKPNAETCVAAFGALITAGFEVEGREMLEMLKAKGAVPEEKEVKEVIKSKRGNSYRSLMSVVLYGTS